MLNSDKPAKPVLTIVTVVYNGGSALEKTMRSVLEQNYSNFEYLVIDGGSNDGSIDIIRKYEKQLAYWVSEPDKGIYDAMNKGIRQAKGQWINFMNCGDEFAGAGALDFFDSTPAQGDILYGNAIIEYPGFETIYPITPLEQMWKKMPFCHQATFARTGLMKEIQFDPRYRLSADFDWLYKAYLAGRKFVFVDRVICRFNFTEGASVSHALKSTRERRDAVLAHDFSLVKWLYYFGFVNYVRLGRVVKGLVGKKITAWVTRRLRT